MRTYGPVPSRRLGRSLGVSPIPAKTCSYNCVYCQLGRTNRLQTERQSFFPAEATLAEIVRRCRDSNPDYVTFVGDGEPTLCSDLGWLIEGTRNEIDVSVAVITNGSLLWREDVKGDLMGADVVIPTLDAGNEKTFKRINRPHRGISFKSMLQGQIDFRLSFSGQLWLEVMLIKGLNDSDEELASISRAIAAIAPDRVYILTPIRPPAESWVRLPGPERILKAQQAIGQSIAIAELESGRFDSQHFGSAGEAIMETGSRHPLRLSQAEAIETEFSEKGAIAQMLAEKSLIRVEYDGEVYLLPARFVRGG